MGYYTISLALAVICLIVVLISFRSHVLPYLPAPVAARLRHYAPLPSFESAMEAGLTSRNFDLSQNVEGEDSRQGLDERATREIRRIMESRRIGFDEARRVWTENMFRKNGIDPNGFPIDPKAITSLS